MLQCRALDRRGRPQAGIAREALLAATTLQLAAGDLLSPEPGDAASAGLAPVPCGPSPNGLFSPPDTSRPAVRLGLCAAAARGLQASAAAGNSPLLLAFAQAGTPQPGWRQALAWAQQEGLPLLLACTDATGGLPQRSARGGEPALSWAAISQLARRTQLPVLSVDGEDAVAVYRVMQESVLRSRHGLGPAVLWAVMSAKGKPLAASQQPVARLRKYMAARGISLP